MPPSGKFSSLLFLSAFLLGIVPANAQNVQATNGCAAIADAASRLACYDALSASGHKPGSAAAQENSHWPEFNNPARRSASALQPAPPPRQNGQVSATIASYELKPDGRFVVTLDNGQVWRQLPTDAGKAQFRERNRVVISRGFWHSYDLKLNGMNAVFKVERVR